MKNKTKIRRYKNGGYVKEEHPMCGVTVLEMNSKGFYEEFAKPLIKEIKKLRE
jgi:hypothetical protein